jgi:hypothetical protein
MGSGVRLVFSPSFLPAASRRFETAGSCPLGLEINSGNGLLLLLLLLLPSAVDELLIRLAEAAGSPGSWLFSFRF